MKKTLLTIITIILSLSYTYASEPIMVGEGYDFTIGNVESIEEIVVPDSYLIDENNNDNLNNKIYLVKINNYEIKSYNKEREKFNKGLYIYIPHYYQLINIGDFKIGGKVIFKSFEDIKNQLPFEDPYYKNSIIDLFYNEENRYIIPTGNAGIAYISCEDKVVDITPIYPTRIEHFYSSIAFINPDLYQGEKGDVFEIEERIALEQIHNTELCGEKKSENNETVGLKISEQKNTGGEIKSISHQVNQKSIKSHYLYIILGLVLSLSILYIFQRKK